MCAIPARAAGVKEIVVCTPKPTRALMMAAQIAGLRMVYRVGGAQAIAAMAYGTLTIPRVEKVVGPGNAYVTEAKIALRDRVDIDMPAGPSEVVVVADGSSDPELIALDLLAQAEHGPGGMCLCVCTSRSMAKRVEKALGSEIKRAKGLPVWVGKNIAISLVKTLDEAIDLANELAPEHVSVACADAGKIAERITVAGTVCVGKDTAVAFGDYSAGVNHVLPTGGAARTRGGLSVRDFLRQVQYLRVSDPGPLASVGMEIARAEGFAFHEASMRKRKGR